MSQDTDPLSRGADVDVAAEADRLTVRLLELERRFASMPWKVEVTVAVSDDHALSFERSSGTWAFYWHQRHFVANETDLFDYRKRRTPEIRWTKTLLKDSSITAKSKAASVISKLYDKMKTEHANRVLELRLGHAELDVFMDGLGSQSKESA